MLDKLYTFLNDNDDIIEQVIATSHAEAVCKASDPSISTDTDFYSEER